jgi:hypothetical protein
MTKPVKDETVAFFRGSWSGNCKKTIKNMGGNFWGPTRNRCTIIPPDALQYMLDNDIAKRVPGGIKFKPVVSL